MYRNEMSPKLLNNPNLVDKLIIIILPNYFYEYTNVLQHLLREKFGIIEKAVKNFKRDDVIEWKSADMESQDIWGLSEKLAEGPSMLLLCERANAFISMREIAKYHNAISQRINNSKGVYFSSTTIAAYHDILFFYPKYVNEKVLLDHAKNYLSVEVWPKLSEALARIALERPNDPIRWLADYLQHNR